MAELGQLETLYNQIHNEGAGVQVISYNGWDDAYTQYDSKYNYYGHTLPQDFLDAETNDFYTWRIPGNGYYSQTSVVGTNGYIYWMEAYSFSETEIKNALRRTINGDTTPPYCSDPYPSPGATGVDVNTFIYCKVKDAGSGVQYSSVKMTVTAGGNNVGGNLDIQGNFLEYELKFYPTNPLPGNTLITVKVDAKDLFGNTMPTYTWTFTTLNNSAITPTSFGRIKAQFK